MRMLVQPTMWSCLPTCVAMLTELPIADIYDFCGHDGSEIVYPDEPYPMDHRSFTVQEMIDFLLASGYYPCTIWPEDDSADSRSRWEKRLMLHLQQYDAIVVGTVPHAHAVVWNHVEKQLYNPLGYKSTLAEFQIDYAILIVGVSR